MYTYTESLHAGCGIERVTLFNYLIFSFTTKAYAKFLFYSRQPVNFPYGKKAEYPEETIDLLLSTSRKNWMAYSIGMFIMHE